MNLKLYRRRGPDVYIYFNTLVIILLVITMVLSSVVFADGRKTHQTKIKHKMENLNKNEAELLVSLSEQADQPGVRDAKAAIENIKAEKEAEKQAWLAEQEKRIAAKKEAEAKAEAEKKAKEEKKKKEQVAKENTAQTSGSAPASYNGAVLTKSAGTVMGPSGKETYYNLDMSTCVRIMRNMGYSEAEYPYAVREDGVKTLGGYVMVAANLGIRPKGSLIQTSRGTGIVVDTGGFAHGNPTQLDLCVNW